MADIKLAVLPRHMLEADAIHVTRPAYVEMMKSRQNIL